ncbi:Histidine kinase osmosensor, partial [Cryomyces antarcticus]
YGNDDEDAKDTARKEGFLGSLTRWRRGGRPNRAQREEDERRRVFRIPGKVRDRKHVIHDELTDLTQTFNEMSDELMMQYERLEERVKQRTAELELSKKAAEAANESKTLFIANISHELKTPLNGILGMCAVCMQEDDPTRLKRSLGIIYKSGDLLLNLLTDLLTFSKNQVGQQLSLDEKEFRLRDISSQVLAIFDKQSKEGQIDLEVKFQGLQETETSDLETANDIKEHGPFGFGRLKDMTLWGDQHRILQVVINLVSNSLKFTGPGGKVVLSIKCLGAAPSDGGSRKTSVMSKQSRLTSVGDSKHRSKLDSDISVLPQSKYTNTANEINITDKGRAYAQIMAAERSPSPPLGRNLLFEFEVEDTGPGIAEHQQQRIFEPFVQGDLGLSKKYGGTGLGLSICSQLAGLMRGTISLKSQVGVGSTFTMRIPLRHILNRADSTASSRVDVGGFNSRRSSVEESRASPARPPPDDARSSRSLHSANSAPTTVAPVTFEADSQPRLVGLSQPFFASTQPLESPGSQMAAMERVAAEATKGERVRVLVAEDNKVNQEVVLRMLKLEDIYNVTVAKDGQEALDKVKESMETHKPYDLIFMDVQMPNLDGLQSTRLIREIGYSAPIVALTAFAEESNVKDCLDSGMNYFLSKPIRRPALKKVLKEYCQPIPEVDENGSTPEKEKDGATSTATPVPPSRDAALDGTRGSPPVSPKS